MKMPDPKTLGEQVETAFNDALRKAIKRHRRLGVPIAYMQDGKIVIVEPDAITPSVLDAPKRAKPRHRS